MHATSAPDTFLATIPPVTTSQPVGLPGAAVADRDVDPAVAVVLVGDAEREKSATVCVKPGEVLLAKFASPP